ncbi:MAG: 4Fe-4S binding protein [candidate division Zixibacteria bacterium]|nr:4Fe-4S binding protein [candidate division Zixibacteria bacterium]
MKNIAGIFVNSIAIIFLVGLFGLGSGLIAGSNIYDSNTSTDDSTIIQNDDSDEFGEFEEFDDNKGADKFDEFENLNQPGVCSGKSCLLYNQHVSEVKTKALYWVLGVLAAVVLAGFLVRFKTTRSLRGIFLIASIAVLGFYKGACPCPISSFSNLILWFSGVDIPWQTLVWFLGLIPITYLLGKVWCGWICHLGALQEILFLPGRFEIFRSERAQKVMKTIRLLLLATLIIQLLTTKTYLFSKIDPFKVAFNLMSINLAGWLLLALLLLSSLFIYRPFCKAACPIGLVLGWLSKVPGASVIGVKSDCSGCKVCSKTCTMDAIIRKDNYNVLDNKECIACGDCIDACKKDGLAFVRKGKENNDKVILKRKCKH